MIVVNTTDSIGSSPSTPSKCEKSKLKRNRMNRLRTDGADFSCSHLILRFQIREEKIPALNLSLCLVDLAGHERKHKGMSSAQGRDNEERGKDGQFVEASRANLHAFLLIAQL